MRRIMKLCYTLFFKLAPAHMLTLSSLMADSGAVGFFLDLAQKLFARKALLASRAFFNENANRIERVLALMGDEKSREIYRAVVRYRCRRRRRDIRPCMQKKRTSYLDPALILPQDSEVFIDCGAYMGDSSLAFQAHCLAAGKPAPLCVLFEPEAANIGLLQKWLPKFIREPFLFQKGLWSQAGRLRFASGFYSSSRIEASGGGSIDVDTLDRMLGGLPELPPVTYIKIDVEGADLEVLQGARKTIQKDRPRIAVSIYHSDEHMLQIPEVLHEMCPSYRFFVRHYSCCEAETVLYCLP